MLVVAGLVTEEQVSEALSEQKKTGHRLGETLVELGYVTEPQMTQVVSNQLSIPWVDLYHVDFSRELLDLVSSEIAERFCLIPVYVRHVRRQGDTLYVAMDDPLNVDALQEVADGSGLPVKPMVAAPNDIRNAIRVYYLGLPPLEEETNLDLGMDDVLEASEAAPASADDDESVEVDAPDDESEPPPAEEPPAEEPEAEERPPIKPSVPPAPRPGPGFLTLTLLDGTTVKLPSAGEKAKEKKEDRLTTRDLIHALRAKAAGADVSDILPDDAWEPLLASLLSLLLRKGLIADWEFVDEWNKQRRTADGE